MNIVDFVSEYWSIILAAIVIIAGIIVAIIKFAVLPSDEQIENLKEWLRWAVAQAEKDLGAGTGQLKLHEVYDMAVERFPWVGKFIPFESFSTFVDEALVWLREQLGNNANIKAYVDASTKLVQLQLTAPETKEV